MAYLRLVIGGMVAVASLAAAAENVQPVPSPTAGTENPAAQELVPGSPSWVAREYLVAVRERGFAAEA